jgi:hypothetical protein
VLYHSDKEIFAGKYKRARCAKRLLRTGHGKAAANCPAALYLPSNDFSLFQHNPDVKHTCMEVDGGINYHDEVDAIIAEDYRYQESMRRVREQR